MRSHRHTFRGVHALLVAHTLVACLAVLVQPAPAGAAGGVDEIAFPPVADAFVNAADPTRSYGTTGELWVDASPVKQTYLRFDLGGLADRDVQRVVLRMHSTDSSANGGDVHEVAPGAWGESVTYNTRPAIGARVGTFGPVVSGGYHEAPLSLDVSGRTVVSLALTSPSSDGARWASREQVPLPELVVEVAAEPGSTTDGLSVVAESFQGSSNPTYYASNQHLAVTAGGRQLAVHGLHKTGVQLAWRDPAGSWRRRSTGGVTDGVLLSGAGTGDRPATIAVFRDATGAEGAWVVWSGPTPRASTTVGVAVQMRRLSDLDSPAGPTVGPLVSVAQPGMGNFRADLTFERTAAGDPRGVVTWVRRTGSTAYELVVSAFDARDATPTMAPPHLLATYAAISFSTTIVATPTGAQVVARLPDGRVTVLSHDAGAPLSAWTQGAPGRPAAANAVVAAAATTGDEVVSVAETSTTKNLVTVQRFVSGRPQAVEATFTGYTQPAVASDGSSVWVVMVRVSDGHVVSRTFRSGTGWTTVDRVELATQAGGHRWPSVQREVDGRLRILVRSTGGTSLTSRVLAWQRVV